MVVGVGWDVVRLRVLRLCMCLDRHRNLRRARDRRLLVCIISLGMLLVVPLMVLVVLMLMLLVVLLMLLMLLVVCVLKRL